MRSNTVSGKSHRFMAYWRQDHRPMVSRGTIFITRSGGMTMAGTFGKRIPCPKCGGWLYKLMYVWHHIYSGQPRWVCDYGEIEE
mgnify:CR=1 FL=1